MTILTLNEILYFGKIAGICLPVANNPKLLTLKVSVSVSGSPISYVQTLRPVCDQRALRVRPWRGVEQSLCRLGGGARVTPRPPAPSSWTRAGQWVVRRQSGRNPVCNPDSGLLSEVRAQVGRDWRRESGGGNLKKTWRYQAALSTLPAPSYWHTASI